MSKTHHLPKAKDYLGDYERHGHVLVRNIFSDNTVTRIKAFLQSQVNVALNQIAAEIGTRDEQIPDLVDKLQQSNQIATLSPTTKSLFTGHFPLETRLSPILWLVPQEPSFRNLIETILGHTHLYMHMPPAARFVLPGNIHAAVPAHQDISYGMHMSNFITVWVPLVEIDKNCGGLTIFENSHKQKRQVPAEDDDEDNPFWFAPLHTQEFGRQEYFLAPGDAIILNNHIIHQSSPNNSNRCRISVDYRFFPEGETSSKHYLDMQEWKVVPPKGEGE